MFFFQAYLQYFYNSRKTSMWHLLSIAFLCAIIHMIPYYTSYVQCVAWILGKYAKNLKRTFVETSCHFLYNML